MGRENERHEHVELNEFLLSCHHCLHDLQKPRDLGRVHVKLAD